MGLDHTPPDHALDAEDALISECLASTDLVDTLGLRPSEFFSPASRVFFEAAVEARARGESSLSPEALTDHLRRSGRLADVGGLAGVARVLGAIPSSPDVAPLAQIVKEAASVRRLDATLTRLLARCRGPVGDRAQLLEEARAAVEAATEGFRRSGQGLPCSDVGEIPAELPPTPFVCERLHLAPGRPACLVGYAGAGKTLLAADLALAVAAPEGSGVTFWGGLAPDRRGRVLLLDFEVGRELTQRRLLRLAAGRWGSLKDWSGRLEYSCFPRWSLVAPRAEEQLAETLRGRVLCIIDSLTAITPGVDENGREMADAMALLTRVSEATGCAILVLHHEGKPPAEGQRAAHLRGRGHSSIQGIWSSQWAVTSLGEGRLQLEQGKSQFEGGLRPQIHCQICDVHDDEGRQVGVRLAPLGGSAPAQPGADPGAPPVPAGALARVKTLICSVLNITPGLSSKELHAEIKTATRAATDTRYQAVQELLDEGKIECTRKGKRFIYLPAGTITSGSGNRSLDDSRDGGNDERLPLDSLPPR